MQTTKEQLIAENARLENELSMSESRDKEIRKSLSTILESFKLVEEPEIYSIHKHYTHETVTLDWIEISCKIGELKAKSDYTKLLAEKRSLDGELRLANKEIEELNHKLNATPAPLNF